MTAPNNPAARDLYAVLGVDPDASVAEIRRAYRRQALDLHPDRNPDPAATPRFRAAAAAHAVLTHPARRADYERAGPGG